MADRSITVRLRLQDDFSAPINKAAMATEKAGSKITASLESAAGVAGKAGTATGEKYAAGITAGMSSAGKGAAEKVGAALESGVGVAAKVGRSTGERYSSGVNAGASTAGRGATEKVGTALGSGATVAGEAGVKTGERYGAGVKAGAATAGTGVVSEMDRTFAATTAIAALSGEKAGSAYATGLRFQLARGVTRAGASLAESLKEMAAPLLATMAAMKSVEFVKDAYSEAEENMALQRQTEQVIKTTGQAAGVTREEVEKLSMALAEQAGISDEDAQKTANLILTFKNIKNVGADKIFDDTTKAAIDMSKSMGQDARSSAIMLGKALNDPVRGMTALQRVGVTLTEEQKNQVKAMVAAGNTLGAQKVILQEVNSEFGGAAAKMATPMEKIQTLWGRLTVSIGKQLVPALDNAAGFLTDTAIPALVDFADEMSGVGDAAKQLGSALGGGIALGFKAIGVAAKGAAAVIGPLVDGFEALPGPVQEVALVLTAAGIASRVFGSRLTSIGNGVRSAGTGIAGYARGLGQVATANERVVTTSKGMDVQMGRFGSSIARIGDAVPTVARMQGAFVSAAAGAERFPRAAGAAAAAMTGLKSAGSGLMAAMGGPWGLALAGAGIALMAWQKHQQDAAQAALESQQRVEALTETLNKHTGAITDDTKATVAQTLQQQGVFDAAKKLGISYKDITDAATGSEAAQKRVNDRLGLYKKASEDAGAAATQNNADAIDLAKTMGVVSDAVNGSNSEVERSTSRWHELAEATGKEADSMHKLSPAAQEYATALKSAEKATNAAAAAGKAMKEALDDVNNTFLEARGDERGYEAAIDDATAALKKNGKTLDDTTAKGRENAEALDQVASSAQSMLAGMADNGSSASKITSEYGKQHDELVKLAESFGMSATAAKKYADQALKLPKEVKTKITADVTAAQANLKAARIAVKNLGGDFDALPKSVQTHLALNGGKDAKEQLDKLKTSADKMPKELKLPTSVPGADGSMLKLKQLNVTAVDADGKIVSIPCSTPGQAKALHDILALHGAQISADGKHVVITSSAPMAVDTKRKIDNIKGAQVSANGRVVTISTSAPGAVEAYNQIRAASREAAAVNGQYSRITIDTIHRHITEQLSRYPSVNADGGLYGSGGVKRMAAGGVVQREAMIASRPILWAEAGPEAYIPLSPAKNNARTEMILRAAADTLGYDVIRRARKAADGYMSSWASAMPAASPTVVVQGGTGGGLSDTDRALLRQSMQVSQKVLAAMPKAVESGLAGRKAKDAQSAHLARRAGGGF